jgi:hypothetical protein
VKWQLTNAGLAVSDPASFAGLYSYPVSCTTGSGSIELAIEEYATGGTSLTYTGNGNWQYNWATPKNYNGTCRVMYVLIRNADGTTTPSPGANFKFK